ncbi:metallophosphoesterase [Pedobacter sp. L105]|uniref:metallophosphoesterase n=1 Tax=Pedobacter sp. L105 TaxID=1641871 RepID=UPI00131D0D3B|nr:metallophosphoesterase [Pedobacter sp. L105]
MKPYKPSKMVNWFEPGMLFQTGLRSVVSALFGNYADRRETEAALSPLSDEGWEEYQKEYAGRQEIWIDYICDTGDGFNPTFSVASLAAQKDLKVHLPDDSEKILPRGKLLLLGGDQVYPTPAGGLYKQKFSIPFQSALPENSVKDDIPHLYAIPGNHDWYDGLSGFLKLFCQQRMIGNWQTKQPRSYFARPLPNNYWIWATDIQLNEDIDKPQLDYFLEIATNHMQPNSKVILITAEPAWIYKELVKDDTSYDRFRFFIDFYITGFKVNDVKRGYQIATIITGDLHHYSHYCTDDSGLEANHYFGAGGGGAFLHLTHNLPQKLNKVKQNLKLHATFPDRAQSYKLLTGNLLFFIKNRYFSALLGGIYLLFFWLLRSSDSSTLSFSCQHSFANFSIYLGNVLINTPFLSVLSISLIAGFWKFTDTTSYARGVQWFGALHGLLQCISIYAMIWLMAQLPCLHTTFGIAAFLIMLVAAGGIWGGFIMGIYLFLSNILFGNHINEASSSLACEDYKCFLKLHINQEGLTIYPIGIKKATKKWSIVNYANGVSIKGELPEIHLIEKPVFIKSN